MDCECIFNGEWSILSIPFRRTLTKCKILTIFQEALLLNRLSSEDLGLHLNHVPLERWTRQAHRIQLGAIRRHSSVRGISAGSSCKRAQWYSRRMRKRAEGSELSANSKAKLFCKSNQILTKTSDNCRAKKLRDSKLSVNCRRSTLRTLSAT